MVRLNVRNQSGHREQEVLGVCWSSSSSIVNMDTLNSSAYTLHGSFSSSRIEDANSSCMEQSSSTPVENIRKEWPSTPADGDGKPVNKSQTLADEVTFEQHTRMARGDANLAEQSNEGVIHSGDKKESDKAVSGNASEKPPSLQSLDDDGDDGDDAPWDDAPPDEPPYQAPGEM